MRPATKKRIKELGYKGYRGYLLSDAWKKRRERYFRKHPKQCWICGKKTDIHLHHCNYERVGGRERDSDLVPLCRSHHRGVHGHMKHHRIRVEVAHVAYKAYLDKRSK